MTRILVTGSADGLGKLAAETLVTEGHQVVVHVRSDERRDAVADLVERGADVVVGDLSDADATRGVAEQVARIGTPDAVIHNAGVYRGAAILPVNVVAPYLLTALLDRPARIVVLSSGMHHGGRAAVDGLDWAGARETATYSDSKLLVTTFAMALARRWPDVLVNAVDPGWVPTRMGGPAASDDLEEGHRTQEWLVTSEDPAARTSGGLWYHRALREAEPAVHDAALQGALLDELARVTGETLQG